MNKLKQNTAVVLMIAGLLILCGFGTTFPVWSGDVSNVAGSSVTTIGTGVVTRAKEAADGKPWTYLGVQTATVSAISTPVLVWANTCQEYEFHYIITGYSGNAVGRFLVGGASISNSGATNATAFSEGVTASSSLTAAAGVPLAVTVTAIAREGWIKVYGASGAIKSIDLNGQNGNPSASTAPTLFRATGFFSDGGTNLPLQRAQLSVYLAITGSAISSTITFNGGTSIEGWCRNGD